MFDCGRPRKRPTANQESFLDVMFGGFGRQSQAADVRARDVADVAVERGELRRKGASRLAGYERVDEDICAKARPVGRREVYVKGTVDEWRVKCRVGRFVCMKLVAGKY